MTLGTALFHSLNTAAFERLDSRISTLQGRISDGTNDPRPSVDPGRAMQLSAATEQKAALARFSASVARASDRLDQADMTLGGASDIVQRIGEIALRAASDSTSPSERASLGTELGTLRKSLVDLANARDGTGRPLFSGFRTGIEPFAEGEGGVVYRGDGGRHRLQGSESVRIDTGLNGAEVFMSIPDATGTRRDVFGMIDDLARALTPTGATYAERASGAGAMTLEPVLGRAAERWSMTLEGPAGPARIEAELVAGALGPAVEAINAETATTGITAALNPEGTAIMLSAPGAVSVSGLATQPARGGVLLEADGRPMVAEGRSDDGLVAGFRNAAEHFADRRAELGAMGAAAARQADLLERRETALAGVLSRLEDLDIAEAVTRLQELMLNRQVSQQTYVRLSQSSLFDYLR